MPGLNYAMRWFYRALAQGDVAPGPEVCAVCGLSAREMVPAPKVFRRTFVDYHLLAFAEQEGVCPACVWYFDHQELRRSHWFLTPSEVRPLAKGDILPLLLAHLETPPAVDRYYLISLTKQKHVALRARLNAAGAQRLRVNLETEMVDLDRGWLTLLDNVVRLRQYHHWDEIELDHYLPYALLRWPRYEEFERCRAVVRPWLRSAQYALAKFLYSPDLGKKEGGDGGLPSRV